MTCHRIASTVRIAVCLGMAAWVAGSAAAASINYSFSTHALPYGTAGGPVTAFANTDSVNGAFVYDPTVAFTQTAGNGGSIYNLSITELQGSVGSRTFTDPGGYTAVGDDIRLSAGAPPTDWLQLGADPTAAGSTKNIVGFDLPGYRLVNVRLFWIEGQSTPDLVDDFVSSQALLASLPTFNGRLGLDFVPLTGGATTFVFFDGLLVKAVAEPGSLALLACGLLLLRTTHRA